MELSKQPEDIDLRKYWQILNRQKTPAIIVFLVIVILAIIAALLSEKKYAAYGKLKFTKENTASTLVAESSDKLGKLETLSSTATPVDTEAEVIKSVPVVREVIKQLDLTTKQGELVTYENFLAALKVNNIPGTDVLVITYKNSEGEEAKAIVNKVMEVYLDKNIEINRTQAKAAREFIIQQLPITEAELYKAELKLKTFQEQNNIVNLNVETELAANRIGSVEEQIDLAQVNLSKVNSQISEIERKLSIDSQEAIALNTINDSPGVQQILTKLNNVEDSLAISRSRYTEDSPTILSIKAQKAELEKELQKRVRQSLNIKDISSRKVFQTGDIQKQLAQDLVINEVQRQSLIKELISLQEIKNASRERNNFIPQLQLQYRDLLRKADVAQTAYKNLLQNLQQAQIIENQNVGNAHIVSQAVASQYPVSTSRKLIVAAGMIVGGILAVITAFSLELKDPSFKTSKELRQSLDYKLLAMIPNLEQKDFIGRNKPLAISPELQTTRAPASLISEAYKMLYTNLEFLVSEQDIKVITITSSIPQEGKSTVSANLASVIAQLGQKVLLIDGDLHRPRQQSVWNLEKSVGLIEVLLGQIPLSEVIQSSRMNPLLDILSAGQYQTEYLSLLKSQRMGELIARCRDYYDLIVIDTPPALLFADTLTISKNTDGIVLVGRLGVTNPAVAKNAKELLNQSQQRILGVVINGINNELENYYQYVNNYDQGPQLHHNLLPPSSSS